MPERRAVLERSTTPWQAFLLCSLIAVVVGLFVSFLFGQADPRYHSVRNYLGGALIGFSTNTWSLLGQLLVFKLIRPRGRLTTLACRYLPFFAGGGLGLVTGGLFLGGGGIGAAGSLGLQQILGFGTMSVAIGAVYELVETLKESLRLSVERTKEQEFAERELRAARSLQRRLLPPNETKGLGYCIAARNVPSLVVSGDFYDVFPIGSDRVYFAIGDVAGKGMSAGLIMASVKAMLPLVAAENGVAQTLRAINRHLFRSLASREFVALCLGCFEPSTGKLFLANSGLPDAYRLACEATEPTTLAVPGPRLPLGMRNEVEYEELIVSLGQGDRVVFMTDGLPEAVTPLGEPLGYEAIEQLLGAERFEAPIEPLALIDGLFDEVRSLTQEVAEDDWTALALEVVVPS